MITVESALKKTALQVDSSTPKLDAELLVSRVLKKDRSYCYAYPEVELAPSQFEELNELVRQRKEGMPMAYLLGEKEFWSRAFIVTQDCLIPRPETELLVEWCLDNLSADKSLRVADLGTGSGAIGITLAAERPNWQVAVSDISHKALFVAKQNAIRHGAAHISFHLGAWLGAFDSCEVALVPESEWDKFDVIISNPPYIDADDPHLEALSHEPAAALVSDDDGYADLKHIIESAPKYLSEGGHLVLEHGADQQDRVVALLEGAGYQNIRRFKDFAGKDRMVVALIDS